MYWGALPGPLHGTGTVTGLHCQGAGNQWPCNGFLTRFLSLLQPLPPHGSELEPEKLYLSFPSLPPTNRNDQDFSSRSKRVILRLSQREKTSLSRWGCCLYSTQQQHFCRKTAFGMRPNSRRFCSYANKVASPPLPKKNNKHITCY